MATPINRFQTIWGDALKDYEVTTGKAFDVTAFSRIRTVDELVQVLDLEDDTFRKYRQKNHTFLHMLSEVLKPVEAISNLIAGGTSLGFPPSSLVFGATTYLIKAAKGVSVTYDAIQGLFECLKVS